MHVLTTYYSLARLCIYHSLLDGETVHVLTTYYLIARLCHRPQQDNETVRVTATRASLGALGVRGCAAEGTLGISSSPSASQAGSCRRTLSRTPWAWRAQGMRNYVRFRAGATQNGGSAVLPCPAFGGEMLRELAIGTARSEPKGSHGSACRASAVWRCLSAGVGGAGVSGRADEHSEVEISIGISGTPTVHNQLCTTNSLLVVATGACMRS